MSWFSPFSQFQFLRSKHRRMAQLWSAPSSEPLEIRQMLSAVAVDVATDFELTAGASQAELSNNQNEHGKSRGEARPVEVGAFVKPWQGNWDVFSDIPFLDSGTISITQTTPKPTGVTAIVTGMSDAIVRKVKVLGDVVLSLQLRVFNSISQRTVSIRAALVLDVENMRNFQGDAKVQGGSNTHTFWGQRLSGPSTAMVEIRAASYDTDKDGTEPGIVVFGLYNHGDAAVPRAGAQLVIEFIDQAGDPEGQVTLVEIKQQGFVSVQPTTLNGHTAVICVSEFMLNPVKKTIPVIIIELFPPLGNQVTIIGTLVDSPSLPNIPEVSETVNVA